MPAERSGIAARAGGQRPATGIPGQGLEMILACPHCFAVYELPRHLLGPGGAAVRCPHCAAEFTLGADGEVVGATVGATHTAEATAVSRSLAPAAPGPAPVRATVSMRAPEAALGSAAARADAADATDRGEAGSDPQAVARRVLEELVARKGPAMADANARGRLLSEFGAELAAAFEQFRKESGGTGNPAPFREVLRERWGIDLTPPARG